MSSHIVQPDGLPVNVPIPVPDAMLIEAHRQIVGLDQIRLAELVLADTAHLTADARLVRVRLAAVALAAHSSGAVR